MSPLGFAVHRQTFPRMNRDRDAYDDYYYDYYYDFYDYYQHDYSRPVPIWLCVFLVVSKQVSMLSEVTTYLSKRRWKMNFYFVIIQSGA